MAKHLTQAGVSRLVIGGGETSGAVILALAVKACTIGPEIDPGLPALSVEARSLAVALKSGNFGAVDSYDKAARMLAGEAA